jgi:molecular chaperone Hsp33
MKRSQSRVNIRIAGDGPLGVVFVDAGLDGTVRGYVGNPEIELPPKSDGKLDVGRAVGPQGFLYVIRDVGYGYPYSGTVELVSGEIGEDVAHYLAVSEQTPSALMLGVFVEPSEVAAAGGLLIQVMPQAVKDEALVASLESRIAQLSGFSTSLKAGKTLSQILQDVLGDFGLEFLPETQLVRFQCRCSFDRVLGALKMLGTDELQDMIEKDNGAEATCHFCNEVYKADRNHLSQLINDLRLEFDSSVDEK